MLRLGLRLALRRLRRAPSLLLLAALALSTLIVLAGVAVDAAQSARSERAEQRTRLGHGESAVAGATSVPIEDRYLTVVASWASPNDPAVLPGIKRNPRPGEVLVSPALADVLRARPELRARIQGRVSGVLPDAALLGPDEWVALAGFDSETAAPPHEASGPAAGSASHLAVAMTTTLILIPSLVLVSAAARFDARQGDWRAAALQVIGASPRQLALFRVIETAMLSVPAGIVALMLGWILRPAAGRVALGGSRFFAADLSPDPVQLVLALLAAPLLGAFAGVFSLRSVSVDPLQVTRLGPRPSLRVIRVLPLVLGLALFLTGAALSRVISEAMLVLLEVLGLGLSVVGLALAGPVAIQRVARRFGNATPIASRLVAYRRLERDPAAGFRTVVGLVLAAFVFGFVSALDLTGGSTQTVERSDRLLIELNSHPAARLLERLADTPGVRAIAPMAYGEASGQPVLITTCQGVDRVLDVNVTGSCEPGGVLLGDGQDASTWVKEVTTGANQVTAAQGVTGAFSSQSPELSGMETVLAVDTATMADLDVIRVLVRTDGSSQAWLNAIRTAATAVPLALVGDGTQISSSGPAGAAVTSTLRFALLCALVISAAGLAIAVGETLVERRRSVALLSALGMTDRDARDLASAEVGVPLVVAGVPALLGGFVLASIGGLLLGGDIRGPSADLLAALGLVFGLAAVAVALLRRLIVTTPTFDVLRLEH